MPYLSDKGFNDALTNEIVSFEQLGQGLYYDCNQSADGTGGSMVSECRLGKDPERGLKTVSFYFNFL